MSYYTKLGIQGSGGEGPQGPMGPAGIQGVPGYTGPTGPSSLSGLTTGDYIKATSSNTIGNSSVLSESGSTLTAAGTLTVTPTSNGIVTTINNSTSNPVFQVNTSTGLISNLINSVVGGTSGVASTTAFQVKSTGNNAIFTVDNTSPAITENATVTIQPPSNTTSCFKILNTSSTGIFVVDNSTPQITVACNLVPSTTTTFNLGSGSSFFNNCYFKGINSYAISNNGNASFIGGTTSIGYTNSAAFSVANTSSATTYFTVDTTTPRILCNANIIPVSANTINIGSNLASINNIYGNYLWCSNGGLSSYASYVSIGYNSGSTPQDCVFYGNARPASDNSVSCGSSGSRWTSVWASNGAIQTSDINAKSNIIDSTLGLPFITSLQPKQWSWNNDTSGDIHFGLVYQDLNTHDANNNWGFLYPSETTTTTTTDPDTGVSSISTSTSEAGIVYTELIGPMIQAIKDLNSLVTTLQSTVTSLQSTVSSQATTITSQASAITSLQSTVNSQATTIANLQTSVIALQSK